MANNQPNQNNTPRNPKPEGKNDIPEKPAGKSSGPNVIRMRPATKTVEAMFLDPRYTLDQMYEVATWCKGDFSVNRQGHATITKVDSVSSVLFQARPGDYIGKNGEGQYDFIKISADEVTSGAWELL